MVPLHCDSEKPRNNSKVLINIINLWEVFFYFCFSHGFSRDLVKRLHTLTKNVAQAGMV